jgi:hypothetical protein
MNTVESPSPKALVGALSADPPQDSKRLRLRTIGQSLNRLSALQRNLLVGAYALYAKNPRLAPADDMGVPYKPDLTFAEMRAGVKFDETAPQRIPHLFSFEAIGLYLGISPPERWKLNRDSSMHRFGRDQSKGWWLPYVEPKRYATAHAAVSRAIRRMESRGLAVRYLREAWDSSGIRLTVAGVAIGRELTGIDPAPRSWEAQS